MNDLHVCDDYYDAEYVKSYIQQQSYTGTANQGIHKVDNVEQC